MSQISALQLEAGSLAKKEGELKQQLTAAMAEVQSRSSEWAAATHSLKETEENLEEASNLLKDEKQKRKTLEMRVKQADEEISELKIEKESLEKVQCDKNVIFR